MHIGSTFIDDTFAEAFGMHHCRLLITAFDEHWLDAAVREFCGYGSSVIACDLEIGLECQMPRSETPDGRFGASVLAFGFSTDGRLLVVAVCADRPIAAAAFDATWLEGPEGALRGGFLDWTVST